MNIVEPIKFLINENILNKMKKFYDSQMVPFESENLLLKAHAIGCDIEVTSNYEASFLGQNAVHEAKHWSRSLAIHILVLQKQDLLIFLGRFVSLHAMPMMKHLRSLKTCILIISMICLIRKLSITLNY